LGEFGLESAQTVLDPFCGTGTTLVECRKQGIPSVGVEANPVAFFASSVKVDWDCDPDGLVRDARSVAASACSALERDGIKDEPFFEFQAPPDDTALRRLPEDRAKLLLRGSISPLPLHKTLVLLEEIETREGGEYARYEKLALAKALVTRIGNLHFGPEVGVGKQKDDAPVVAEWLSTVTSMAEDIRELAELPASRVDTHLGDSRSLVRILRPGSIDAVITSPPYPNEKDYTRTTRLEAVILGFIRTKADLRRMKQGLLRSNTRNVYKADDDAWVCDHTRVQEIADRIEARRTELGKTSGFERLYHRVTKLYFGGMKRHLADLRAVLRPGARLAYVVGDQASYLRVMIRTGELLAEIAESLGYEVLRVDLFRKRFSTTTRQWLREEVVLLKWNGGEPQADASREGAQVE